MNEHLATDVVSIGPYVLAGGELAAMVVADAVIRKLPGALGHEESARGGIVQRGVEGAPEYPHYTRPFDWRGHEVPDVLLSGDHARIREWRREQSRSRRRGYPRPFATMLRPRATAPTVAFFVPMSGVIDSIERAQLRRVPSFQAGDRVRVHFQVVEGTRRRTQVFEGIVLKRQGSGVRETFTVRKQSFGVGVERTFPVHSPKIERIEVAARGDVRRAKLYYLRERVGRASRVRERRWSGAEEVIQPGLSPRRARCRPTTPRAQARRSSANRPPLKRPLPRTAAEDGAGGEAAAEAEQAPAEADRHPRRPSRRRWRLRPGRRRPELLGEGPGPVLVA